MARSYVEAVAVDRPTRANGLVLLGACVFLLFAWLCYYAALEPLPLASESYLRALRATHFARMGWALFFGMSGLWLIAQSTRQSLGIPVARRAGARWFVVLRNLLTALFLYLLLAGLIEPVASPDPYEDSRWFMGCSAAMVWLAFAVDLIPLVRRAMVSLGARVSRLSFRRSTVGGSETGPVRIEGTIAIGDRFISAGIDKLIYRHSLNDAGESQIECVPFLLESKGKRLFVDVVADKTVIVPAVSHDPEVTLGEGDEVEVWGDVSRPEDIYRGQSSRIGPKNDRLYVFQGGGNLNGRLLLAALVELLASASFLLVGVAYMFYIFDLYLFLI